MPRSKRATKPRKRKTKTKAEKLPTSKGRHIGLRWVARVLLGALALIGSLLGIYGYLVPKISVASSSLLEPTKPFSAPFTISNSGNVSVRHVRFRCVILNAEDEFHTRVIVSPAGITPTDSIIPEINPGETSTVGCPFPFVFDNPVVIADLAIYVKYKPDWIPWYQEKPFRFAITRDLEGHLKWMPRALSDK